MTALEKREKIVKEYFTDTSVEIKVTGEDSENCNVSLWIRIGDFYLETSFIAKQKLIRKWAEETSYEE